MDNFAVNEWVKYADNDIEAACHLLTLYPLKLEIICYLCQQSAEKILKAFWLSLKLNPPKTHDLELLRVKCEEHDETFKELAKECSRLNDYSTQPRYPFGLEIIEDDMRLAIKDSKKINEFIKAKIS